MLRAEVFSELIISVAGAIFCSASLYMAIRDGQTWLRYWPRIERRTNPKMFRLAVCVWGYMALGLTAIFLVTVYRLVTTG